MDRSSAGSILALPLLALALVPLQAASPVPPALVDEHEPNDTPALATVLAPGDTAVGTSYWDDPDYYTLEVDGPALLTLRLESQTPVTHWRFWLRLSNDDGDQLAQGFDWARAYLPEAGLYYIRVHADESDPWSYRLHTALGPAPAGEPIQGHLPPEWRNTSRYGCPAIAGPGVVYMSVDRHQLARWGNVLTDASPSITHVTRARPGPYNQFLDLALDPVGELLALERWSDVGDTTDVLWLMRGGERHEPLVEVSGGGARSVVVGPNGDLWMGVENGDATGQIRRYRPDGRLVSTFELAGAPADLAFAPDGALYFVAFGAVHRQSGGATITVFASDSLTVEHVTIDAGGDLYVVMRRAGGVEDLWRLSSDGVLSDGPIVVTGLGTGAGRPVFLIDESGSPTRRLLVCTDVDRGEFGFVEVNPMAIPHAGAPVGTSFEPLETTPERAARAAMGEEGAVSAEDRRRLDLEGNRNGRLDAGDVLALWEQGGSR